MQSIRTDRLWAIVGALGAAAMLAMGWFFLISPQNAETRDLRDEAVTARSRVAVLENRLTELRQQNTELPRYQAELAGDRRALPSTPALADLLREMQGAGERSGASVTALTVGVPVQVPTGGGQIYAMPVNLSATGSTARLIAFLRELQQVQARAVLITSTDVSADAAGGAANLTLNLQVFVAPPGDPAAGQPTAGQPAGGQPSTPAQPN